MEKNKKGQWIYEVDEKGINKTSLAEALSRKDALLIREIELRAREGKIIRII
jgi:hypothetical protein